MSQPVEAFSALLPSRIDRAEYDDPTLLLGGTTWSMSVTCEWRWVHKDGELVSPAVSGVGDRVWDMVGEEIVRAHWSGPLSLGLDPCFEFRSGGILEIFSDATFDTWVLTTLTVTLVGPLPTP